ncbi:MAG: class I SAM-dependent methyltransferase [Rhodocyclaceae bacterium]|nr:class I SAM-dependent methyltransferase [Rhodocyclaceae bacterium]
MNGNTAFYDAFAPYYCGYYGSVDASEAVRQWVGRLEAEGLLPPFARRCRSPLSLLDLGCGPGWHVRPWQEMGFEVCGLDQSPAMLRIAATALAGADAVKLFCADVCELDSLDALEGAFDLIASHFNFVNLFPPEQLPTVFAGVRKMLAPGGLWATDLTLWTPGQIELASQPKQFGPDCLLLDESRYLQQASIKRHWRLAGVEYVEQYWRHECEAIASQAGKSGLEFLGSFPGMTASPDDALADGVCHKLLVLRRGRGWLAGA